MTSTGRDGRRQCAVVSDRSAGFVGWLKIVSVCVTRVVLDTIESPCSLLHTRIPASGIAYCQGYPHYAHSSRSGMAPRMRARGCVRGAVWDGGDGTSASHQRACRGSDPPSGKDRQPSMGVPRTVDNRGEAVSGPATLVAKLGIPEYRARHEGRLRERLRMNPLLGGCRDDHGDRLDVLPPALTCGRCRPRQRAMASGVSQPDAPESLTAEAQYGVSC
jgi:hypothetical protein